jgi:Domain of unknown function (DUF929)
VPSTRRGSAGGPLGRYAQSSGTRTVSAKARARERIAAQRIARKRAETRMRLLLSGTAVAAVLGVVALLIGVQSPAAPAAADESRAASAVVRQATSVPLSVITRASVGHAAAPLEKIAKPGPSLTIDGKATVVFVSEESCPFCAAERWSLVVALSHFGTWSNLGSTRSSATDVYPNTATFSFRSAHYHSAEITLRTTELADNLGHRLQAETPLDAKLIATYDVPPFVNSADQSGAVPFLDIANRYILAGAQYNPQILAGLSGAQIASQLRNPSSPVAQAIDGSADEVVAAIDQVLHQAPRPGGSTGQQG